MANHISKYYYGCPHKSKWVDGKFALEDKEFDQREQTYMAVRQIKWYLKKVNSV